jgi:hypothetical protein
MGTEVTPNPYRSQPRGTALWVAFATSLNFALWFLNS